MKHNLFFRTISKFSYVLVIFTLLFSGLSISPAKAAPAGTALQFNGSSQYATFGAAPSLGAATFTLETWFKRTGAGVGTSTGSGGITAVPLVTKGRAEAEGSNVDMNYFLGIDATSGKLAADFEEGSSTGGTLGLNHPVSGNTVVTSNVWHHAAATYDGQTWKLYLDGVLDGTLTLSAARPPRSDSIQHAALATAMNSTGVAAGFFQGVLDESRIWNYARTQAEIQANLNQEITSGTGLLGRWGMNEGSGATVNNSVLGGVNGTTVGSPTWVPGFPIPDTTPPAAPTNLAASALGQTVNLTWTANSESDLAGYNVYRSTSPSVPLTGPINGATLVASASYADGGRSYGTQYYYVITAVDTSNNQSTASNEVSVTPLASNGAGLSFDGSNDYVTFGPTTALGAQNFTVETWFKRTAAGTSVSTGTNGVMLVPLVAKGAPQGENSSVDENYVLGIRASDNVLAGDFEIFAACNSRPAGDNNPIVGVTPIVNNTWYHAAFTYDGAALKLYLNGNLESTLASTCIPRYDNTQPAALGTTITTTPLAQGFFAGVMDEARIWSVARTQAQILADINNELTSGTNLIARWGMNEGTGTSIASSVGTFPGTLTNGPLWVAGAPFDLVVDTTAPAAPQNLAAVGGNAQVSLTWNANSESDLAGYNIYRSTTSPVSTATPLNGSLLTSPAYTDTSVTNGTTYYYVVTAIDTSNNISTASNEVNAAPVTGSAALQFDGTNDYVTFGPAPSLGSATFTIETWFKRTGAGVGTNTGSGGIASAIPLVTKGRAESEGSAVDMNYFMGIDSATGKLVADFEDMATGTNHPVSGTTVISSNSWHHAAATYDGTTWKLYLDGNLEATLSVGETPRSDSIQHAALATAMNSTGVAAGFFQGVLDEPRVWNYARTQAEIQDSLHTQVPSAAGLIGRWGLNEGVGTTANDSSGSGVNGTLANGPTWVAGTTFNAAPVVNAGPDQSVSMPGGVNLPGTATDDGLPNPPATLTLLWSKVSGPGTVTFSDPSSASTSALFSTAGTYVLRLSANDGETTSSDDVTVSASLGGNTALDFGGTDAYVNFSNPAKLHLSTFTVETWFRREGAGITTTTGTGGATTAIPLVARGRGEAESANVDLNYFLGIDATTNTLVADFEEGAGGTSPSLNHPVFGTTTIPVNSNTWHHAAATYNGTTWKLYLDGNLESSLTVGQPPAAAGNQYASIGSALTSTGVAAGFFDGVIDESRIWDHALTQAEIQANMPLELTSGNGLVARWGINEGGGTFVNDSMTSPTNGSVMGSNYTWVNGASFAINQPPNAPVLNAPANNANDVSTSPTLDATVSDPDSDNLTVSFYGRPMSTNQAPGPDFTIIPMPDTQHYTDNGGSNAANFTAQTQWIVANKASRNIVFVTGLGDIVENGDTTDSEWQIANSAYGLIEDPLTTSLLDGIPYGLAVGNHDQSPIGGGSTATTSKYNQYFGITRFQGRGYYGGHFGSDNDNNYELFSASGMDFIIIHFEYDTTPEQDVLNWADNLLTIYSDRRAILTTHYMIDTGNPGAWGAQGQAIYNALSDHPNLFLMLGGHVPGEGRRQDTAVNGNVVNTLLSDYQSRPNGGNGWLRIMTFSPANNTISVKTYSPVLNQFETDADSQFTLNYEMQGGTVPFTALGTNSNVPSGSHTTLTWSNLTPATQYEWYATVTDGNKTTNSATYSFTTAGLTYTLTTSTIGNGTVAKSPDQPSYNAGDVVTLTANPTTGSTFTGWSGDASGTTTPLNVTMNSNKSITATFTDINDAPVAVDDSYLVDEDTSLTVPAPGLLANDTDADSNPLTAVKVSDPTHGTLTLNVDGSFSYTPAANYNGTDSFTYKADDGQLESNLATVSITINAVNNPPVCAATSITTNEDTSGTVAPSCTDAENVPLSYAIAAQPSNGTAVVENGLLKYTPSANFNVSDSFTYTANDGTLTSTPATVSVTVNPVNDPPVANNQSVETNEDILLPLTLSGSDIEGNTLTYALIASPAHGTLSGVAPNLTYTPNADFNGSDSFTFKVNDGTVDSASATVQITIHAINDPPVANNDVFTTEEDVPLNVSAALGVLSNDTDVEGDSLSASLVTGPAHGNLALNPDGSFTYTPDASYSGADGFTYTASDGQGGTANGNVAITVNPVNHPPVADNQNKSTDEDVAVQITLSATDADNDSLTYTVTTEPAHGTLSGTAPNLTYTPAANYYGADSFSFKANDGQADSNVAVVNLTINPVNDPPVVAGQSITTGENISQNVTLNGSDVDGDSLTYQVVDQPAHGTLSGSAPNLVYTPEQNYSGPDNFTFKANDGSSDSDTATISITVTPVNDPPVANDQSVTTAEDTTLTVTLTASDAENDPLTYMVVGNPSHGVLSGTAPNVTYTPALNFNGPDNFTFKANDGRADSNVATISIIVTASNDAPIAVNDSASTVQDTPVTVPILANDSDVDGDALTVTAVTTPGHGSTAINGNGTVTYTPAAGWVGPDSFTYTISDGKGGTASAAVNITVTQNDLIFKDGFDSCNATAWSSVTNSSALSFSASGKTGCGMQVNITSNSPAYVRDDTPNLETRYRARFYFNPNGIVMAKNNIHALFGGYTGQNANTLVIELRKNGNSFQVRAGLLLDARGKWSYSGWSTLSNSWTSIEFDWRAATSLGANNGGLTLWLNGTQVANLTGIDNDQQKVDWVTLGAVSGIDSGTRGTYYFDEFESRRQTYIGP